MSESQVWPNSGWKGELQGLGGAFGIGDHLMAVLGKYSLLQPTKHRLQEEACARRLPNFSGNENVVSSICSEKLEMRSQEGLGIS